MSDDLPHDQADTVAEAIKKAKLLAAVDGPQHILPVEDTYAHKTSEECWCQPLELHEDVWFHYAHDRRHEFEEGRKKS